MKVKLLLLLLGFGIGIITMIVFSNPQVDTEFKTKIITKYVPEYDTIYKSDYKVVYRDTGTHTLLIDSVMVKIEVPVDTMEIIQDYLTIRHYQFDTTLQSIQSRLSIDLYANKILKYEQAFSNMKKCEFQNEFRVGLQAGINDVTPFVVYNRNRVSYLAGFELAGKDKGIRFGISYKLTR